MRYFILSFTATIDDKSESGIIGIISDTDDLAKEKADSHLKSIYRRDYPGCMIVAIAFESIEEATEAQYKLQSKNFKA